MEARAEAGRRGGGPTSGQGIAVHSRPGPEGTTEAGVGSQGPERGRLDRVRGEEGAGDRVAPQVPLCHGALVPERNFKVAQSSGAKILVYGLTMAEPTRALANKI